MADAVSRDQIRALYLRPFLDLVHEAQSVHRKFHEANVVQQSALLSIKTGGCSEDCGYCSQSARYHTATGSTKMLEQEDILSFARRAVSEGATRICMGSSGRNVKDNRDFDRVLEAVTELKKMKVETCVTLGMLTKAQAERLKQAGLDYYNHNIDTSREHYDKVITTRTYDDRLDTLRNVRDAGLHVCTGGILGLGESDEDRVGFLETLSNLDPQPESVTVNRLVPIAGTPLENAVTADPLTVARVIACARILMPAAVIRLSAGRETLSDEAQALCFLAGANSIFHGERLLTTPNAGAERDAALFDRLGLKAKAAVSAHA